MDKLVSRINNLISVGNVKLARTLLEHNLSDFDDIERYISLSDDARVLLRVIRRSEEDGATGVARRDLLLIHEINKASHNFDLPQLKMLIKNSGTALYNPLARGYLTTTAISVITSLGLGRLVSSDIDFSESSEDIKREIERVLTRTLPIEEISSDINTKRQPKVHGRVR